ncbi:unnamed protein product, partial [Linum tenue]
EDPGIAEARPLVPTAQRLAGLAALPGGIELEFRSPLHRLPPQLQLLDSPAAAAVSPFAVALRLERCCRAVKGSGRAVVWIEDYGEDRVDGGEGEETGEEDGERGEAGGFWVDRTATHCRGI